ncbi:esterase-like activity of phytase family protein [Streptomyces sp. NPDC005483]|uniref:esterase-like activity of phytase family protein n=1 Tax=Streptomyces sp. NPDC005483 TaxID=3154882 RepID=UPI0033B81B67
MRARLLLTVAAPVLTALACTAVTVLPAEASASSARAAQATVTPGIGHTCSRWVAINGFSDSLDKTTFEGIPVSELSGLARDTNGQFLAVGDDSHLFTLDGRTKKPVAVRPLATPDGTELDSEAIVVDHDGTRLITDEEQPAVHRYSASGRYLGSLPVPDALKVAPAGRATHNLTFEGLALLSDGRTLVASMEGALTGDDAGIRRLQTWQRVGHSGAFRLGAQFAYRSDAGLDISDITATDDGRLLVLERGFTAGVGNSVRLVLADSRRATDVSEVPELTGDLTGVRPMARTLLTDVSACPSLGATTKQPQPNPLLDNIEGVTVTGHTRDGRLRLLMVSDDNQRATQTTRLYELTARLPRT